MAGREQNPGIPRDGSGGSTDISVIAKVLVGIDLLPWVISQDINLFSRSHGTLSFAVEDDKKIAQHFVMVGDGDLAAGAHRPRLCFPLYLPVARRSSASAGTRGRASA